MHRDVSNRCILLDQGLGSVAVMNIPIDDEDMALPGRLNPARHDYGIRDETESHRSPGEGMMSRRSDRGQRSPANRGHIGGGDCRPGPTEERLPASGRSIRVGIKGCTPPAGCLGKHFQIRGGVDAGQSREVSGGCFFEFPPGRGEVVLNLSEPSRCLRMVSTGIVAKTPPVGKHPYHMIIGQR